MTEADQAAQKLIQLVNNELVEARHSYYVLCQPTMTDAEYDAKERSLKEMVAAAPQFKSLAPVLTVVGSDLTRNATQVKHRSPMLSLENHYTFDLTQAWCSKFPAGTHFVLEPKVDGSSCSLTYLNRKLVKAVTRGNGVYGEDITAAMAASKAVPTTLPEEHFPATPVEIRGEVFMTVGQFNKINQELEANGDKPYVSPRNLASGTLKLKDMAEVARRGLRFFPWQVEGIPEEYLQTRQLSSRFAHHALMYVTRVCPVFPQSLLSIATSPEEVVEFLDNRLRKERELVWLQGLGMQTDGIVIKVDDPQLRAQLGVGEHYPNWGIAWKYPSEKRGTLLKSVTWQVGRTGVLTPVGELEPVNLGGSMVSRVSLNNATYIQELGIEIGDEVLMSKGGEVIPYCNGIATKGNNPIPIQAPVVCETCGAPLVTLENPKSGVQTLWCQNPGCTARLQARLEYVSSRAVLEIEDLGPELIRQLLKGGFVGSFTDLFAFCADIEQGLAQGSQEQVAQGIAASGLGAAQVLGVTQAIQRCKTYEWDRWLMAIDLPGIGKVMARTLAIQARLEPDSLPHLRETLTKLLAEQKVEGIGEIRKADILEYFQANPQFDQEMQELYDMGVRPVSLVKAQPVTQGSEEAPLAGHVICISGEFESYGEREYLQECLASLGATIKTGVSKKLTLLLTGAAPGPAKIAKARDLGIPTEGKAWLEQVFTKHHLTPKPKSGMVFDDDFA